GGNSHTTSGGKRPVDTSGARVERIDIAVVGADINLAVDNARNAEAGHDTGKSKRPLELKLRCSFPGQTRCCGRLEARIRGIGPAVPVAADSLRRAGTLGAGDTARSDE